MNTETQNYKIIVAYDGTRYKGWQVQKSTDDTIQGKLQHVLSTLAGKQVEVIGSGRTDAGVHAVGQVASFHMPKHFSKDEIFIWLNEHLPADIAVTDISNVPDRFHARYNAVSKTYVYTI
ncbi:MAG: tRNA pseudouridine(38-40) synthase TruA, partial [Lachnospiraceae bacterium]|nr:tRNA pseudouridine(38-40) synthase TruA [Lachnospiraceae bacterium]